MDGIFIVTLHSRNHKPSHTTDHMRIILTCNIIRHFDWFGIDPHPHIHALLSACLQRSHSIRNAALFLNAFGSIGQLNIYKLNIKYSFVYVSLPSRHDL